jgi:hypothetical protein
MKRRPTWQSTPFTSFLKVRVFVGRRVALAHERDGYRVGAHAVARAAAGGAGDVEAGRDRQ